jgi:hypothetical protein
MIESLKQFIFAQGIDISTLPNPDASEARLRVVLSLVFSITGTIALLMITIAGFRYTLSHGDPNLIAQSKNTIIYSLIGLLISIFAVAIVQFVLGNV